ncbi:hypothetical protein FCJ57_02745 [Burkholderia diffusa]|nr:hypothetical protein [Burkholderia diffusa]
MRPDPSSVGGVPALFEDEHGKYLRFPATRTEGIKTPRQARISVSPNIETAARADVAEREDVNN